MTREEIERCVEAEVKQLCTNADGQLTREANRYREAIRRNIENWEEWLRLEPKTAREALKFAHAARIMATEHEASPQYAEALRQYLHLIAAGRKVS